MRVRRWSSWERSAGLLARGAEPRTETAEPLKRSRPLPGAGAEAAPSRRAGPAQRCLPRFRLSLRAVGSFHSRRPLS